MSEIEKRFIVAVNKYRGIPGKTAGLDHQTHNDNFINRELTWPDLAAEVLDFGSFTSPHEKKRHPKPGGGLSSYRKKANVHRQQLFFGDGDTGDERATYEYLQQYELIRKYLGMWYESKSHTPEEPRSRIVFATEEPLPADKADKLLAALKWRFPWLDPTPMHRAGVFYGTRPDAELHVPGNFLPLQVVDQLIAEYEAAKPELVIDYATIDDGANSPTLTTHIDGIVTTFENTKQQRHRALFRAGAALGSLYAGLPDQRSLITGATEKVVKAAKRNGYLKKWAKGDKSEVLRTLRDGWRKGMEQPAGGIPHVKTKAIRRDIYSKLLTRIDSTIYLEPGQYLSDIDFDLPRRGFLFANTGTGKTTYAVRHANEPRIICFSVQPSLEQVSAELAADNVRHGIWYQHKKDVQQGDKLILTTYDSLPHVIDALHGEVLHVRLFVDEMHNLAAASDWYYRGKAMRDLLRLVNDYDWRSVTFMSGTPFATTVPALRDYTVIAVDSEVREQRAQVVKYEKGKRLDAFSRTLEQESELKHLILLNNKSTGLQSGMAAAIVAGVPLKAMMSFNADNKHDDDCKKLIETGKLPAGKRLLFATSVIIESVNIYESFDRIHVLSHVHPLQLQQLANRKRGSAVPLVYYYTNGEGKGYDFDHRQEQRRTLKLAKRVAKQLSKLPALDPDSQEAIARRRTRTFYENAIRRIVRPDGQGYVVDHLGVDNEVFRRHGEYTSRNPEAVKQYLARYGWSWIKALDYREDATIAGLSGQRQDVAREMIEAYEAKWIKHVHAIQELGLESMRAALKNNDGDGHALRAMNYISRLLWAMGDDTEERFNEACRIVTEIGDNGRGIAAEVRRINVYRFGDHISVIRKLRAAFADQRLTPDEMRAEIIKLMRDDSFYAIFAQDIYPHAWSLDKEPAVTSRRAVRMFGDVFELKRCKIRQDDGTRVNGYELVTSCPLSDSTIAVLEVVSLNADKDKQPKTLSETTSPEKGKVGGLDDILDELLSTAWLRARPRGWAT